MVTLALAAETSRQSFAPEHEQISKPQELNLNLGLGPKTRRRDLQARANFWVFVCDCEQHFSSPPNNIQTTF